MKIRGTVHLDELLEYGQWAWPGGYPKFFIAADGEALSFEAVKAELDRVTNALLYPGSDPEWQLVDCEINWEDPDLYCAHTGNRIESAYAEPELEPNTEAMWHIRNCSNPNYAWSNELGWVSEELYDIFTNGEKEQSNLPTGGYWHAL